MRSVLAIVVGLATITGGIVPVAGAAAAGVGSSSGDSLDVGPGETTVRESAVTSQADGDLEFNRTTVEFGEVVVGETERAAVQVRNDGDENVSIADVNIEGDDLLSFSVETETVPEHLEPGEQQVIRAGFTPQSTGEAELSLELVTTAGDSLTVTLAGTGVETMSEGGNLSVEPSGLFLGEVAVGEAGTSELTVANTGSGELTIDEFRIGGRNASMFSVGAGSLSLAPGEERSVTVTFEPTSEGPKAADLWVVPRGGAPVEVGLVGAASGPRLVVEPRSLDFGSVPSGASRTRTVTISNDGSGPIEIEDVSVSGIDAPHISIGEGVEGRLGAGESREVTVTFEPDAGGQFTGRLVVRTDSNARSRVTVPVTASVPAPDVRVRPRSLQFGEATVDERIVREFTVANTGEAPLRIEGADVAGDADVFELQQSTPVTVAAGSEATLSVAFRPDEARSFSGTLRLSTNDPDEPTVPVWLTNTNTMVSMSVRERDGTTQVNMSVSNVSSGQNLSMAYTPPDPSANVSVNAIGATVERGGDFTMNVTSSDDPQSTTPEFDAVGENGTEPLNYLSIRHSIANEDIAEATIEVSVRKERIDSMETTDPEDVQLYRYEPETGYVGQDTTFVGETDTHYVYRAVGDGFSEWATGAKQAQFEVVQADVSVSTIAAGDSVNINVRISNTGGADGDFLTELLLDGEVVDTRDVSVAAGGTAQVTFDRAFGQPGDYSIQVNDFDVGEVTVSPSQAGTTTSTTGSDSSDGGGSSAFGPGFGVPAAVLALLVGSLLARRRRG